MMQALRFSTMTSAIFLSCSVMPASASKHQNGDVAARDGFLRALDAEKLHRIVHAARLSHAGGVNQNIFLPHAVGFDLERHVHRVARRAGNRRDDDALGLCEALMMEDLPTFGRPTMASFKRASQWLVVGGQ